MPMCSCTSATGAAGFISLLAVSLEMLEFVSTLFLHLAPNETAWSDALTTFLARWGHVFEAQDSLHRRFASALGQFQILVCIVNAEVDKQIVIARREISSWDPIDRDNIDPDAIILPKVDESMPITARFEPTTRTMNGHAKGDVNGLTMPSRTTLPHPGPDPPISPSDYLRSRCPLCFGGVNKVGESKLPEFFLCLDACFALRQNKDYDCRPGQKKQPGTQDPQIVPPGTCELPRSFLEAWKARVEAARPVKGHECHTKHVSKQGEYMVDVADGEGDCVEPGLRVPNSYLENCGKSFIAADGERVKTPGQHFSDTGMMAGVCCHDRVIIWSNMWMPGEQQFYALAIIDFVMAQLPVHCTLKWNLLPQWMPRIVFGISVFHAYGHQWVCQLWYHPQKGNIWGLTDREGCERLWSDLQSLIPNLRVTGFHHRLFLLDLQIEHQDHLKLCQAGVWLEKHHLNAAQDLVEVLQKQLMLVPLSDSIASRNEVAEITTSIAEQEKIVSRLSKQDNDLTAVLQLGDPISYEKLEKMRGHAWFEHQLNMQALKACIIAKVCEKNFKTRNLTGAFRSKAVDHNTMEHTTKALKRHYRSVKSLVVDYNKWQLNMMKLRGRGGISKNAIIPPPIDMKGLFGLDVNNDIWQDIGLTNDEFDGTVPPWLGDEDVRNGIRLMQEVQWFEDKSAALMAASNACQDDDLKFFLREHIQTLCNLGKRWGQAIDALNVALPGELRGSQRHTNSQSGGVSLVFEVDSSDDEEDFELEPPLVLADSAILAAADYTHQQGLSSDEGRMAASSTGGASLTPEEASISWVSKGICVIVDSPCSFLHSSIFCIVQKSFREVDEVDPAITVIWVQCNLMVYTNTYIPEPVRAFSL
ncbi:hypothetical protein BS47DRAFT_1367076 [Hydnum rufescens UP504]|uniref:Uncharacterized protein n=1 Tax=Hydnum rufescens UP504 TaxID=1448309 RepID=A0A9P6AJ95_9AGAM|nr:hypothetical protein BS47DRAFT_1367076 [Hydnum rufescens UP504]